MFFFSSRRRHTRSYGDWSSDVCSSDLRVGGETMKIAACFTQGDSDYLFVGRNGLFYDRAGRDWDATITRIIDRSEERRVGKEWRSEGGVYTQTGNEDITRIR